MKTPKGVVEDVIVRIKDFYFPVNFLVLNMAVPEKLQNTPIILGRPFLAMAKANINCDTGCMEITFRERKMHLDIFRATKSFDCDWIEEHDPVEPLVEKCLTLSAVSDHQTQPCDDYSGPSSSMHANLYRVDYH